MENAQKKDTPKLKKSLDAMALHVSIDLAQRLAEGGLLNLAHISAHKSHSQELDASFGAEACAIEVESHAGTTLITDLLELKAISMLHDLIVSFERQLLTVFSYQARREINTVAVFPPASTHAAKSSEALLSTSVASGPVAPLYESLWNRISAASAETLAQILKKKSVSRAEVRSFKTAECEISLLSMCYFLLSSAECLAISLRNLSENVTTFSLFPLRNTGEGLYQKYGDYLKHREQILDLQLASSREWSLDKARQLTFDRKYIQFCLELESKIEQWTHLLDNLNRMSQSLGQTMIRDRATEIENYLYVDRLSVHLRGYGETTEEVNRLSELLFKYSIEKNVSCSEIMDEEILRMNPRINKENICRSRLELRMNDRHFPLSVAHKEWVTQITRLETLIR